MSDKVLEKAHETTFFLISQVCNFQNQMRTESRNGAAILSETSLVSSHPYGAVDQDQLCPLCEVDNYSNC